MIKITLPRKFFFLFIIFTIFYSCRSETTVHSDEPEKETDQVNSGDTFYLSDEYPAMPGSRITAILDSMRFCEIIPDKSLPDSLQLYPCTSELFGVFPNTGKSWETGFLMEARQGVWAKSSRVFNIEKSELGYVVTNDMKGQLLCLIPGKNKKHNFIMRYFDSQIGTVAIEHEWKGAAYKPVNVVMINDYPIKDEFRDSLNHYYIDNFVWGY